MASIRPATPADIPTLVAMGEAMHAESRYARRPWNARKVCGLMDWLIANDDGLLLVAERDGQIIGGFMGQAFDHWALDSRDAVDLALFVPPNRRGGLAAAQLVKAYIAWAQSRNAAPSIGTSTGVNTEETCRMFEALGFKPVGHLFEYPGGA